MYEHRGFISRETTIDYQPVTILPCVSNTTITATNCISIIYIRDIIVLVATKLRTMDPRMILCNRDVYFFDHFLLCFFISRSRKWEKAED